MILLGVPVEMVQEILRHADIRTTPGYAQVASELAKAEECLVHGVVHC
jgi:site-specific recombinase XerD